MFTSILNERLNQYAVTVKLILENQANFSKKYCTLHQIFTLYTIIENSKDRKKLYCAFIDFEKAFDSVWRLGLYKILLNNIDVLMSLRYCITVLNVYITVLNQDIFSNDLYS